MKNKLSYSPCFLFVLLILSMKNSMAQSWNRLPPGDGIFGGEYLGANIGSTFPLELKTIPPLDINFYTNNTQHMTILGNNGATDGFVGIGIAAPVKLLHLHQAGNTSLWLDFTNGNTGTAVTDGFEIGINYLNGLGYSDAKLVQFENADMKFYTDFNTTNSTRLTIMGKNNIPNWSDNRGYIGIGNDRPLSKLHIGSGDCYNGAFCEDGVTPKSGWRPWMVVGTFMCGYSDHMYVGLKAEGVNRDDAIINWGDNIGASIANDGPDNLRFVFTEYCSDPSNDGTASSMNGLEVMRMMPLIDANTNFVSVNAGIGNFYANSPVIAPMRRLEILDGVSDAHLNLPQLRLTYTQNSNINLGVHTDIQCEQFGNLLINPSNGLVSKNVGIGLSTASLPQATLDVNGEENLRVVNHNVANDLTRVLVTDPSNNGRLMWRDASTLGGGLNGARSGTSLNGGYVEWGGINNPLLQNTIIPMRTNAGGTGNEWSIYFTGQSSMGNSLNKMDVGIGYLSTQNLVAKIDVKNSTSTNSPDWYFVNQYAGRFWTTGNYDLLNGISLMAGVYGTCTVKSNTTTNNSNIGGVFTATENARNIGVSGEASRDDLTITNDAFLHYGVKGFANNASRGNYGGFFQAGVLANLPIAPTGINIGTYGSVLGVTHPSAPIPISVGVYGDAGEKLDWAGYFNGYVFSTQQLQVSDSNLKNNIKILTNDSALSLLRNLQPKTYVFDTASFPSMSLPRESQIGLISQDVESVLPNLVRESIHPEYSDTFGTNVYDSVKFLSLNYTGFIPILIGAVKEIDSTLTARPHKACNAVWVDTVENKYQWGTESLCHNTKVPMIDDSLDEWNIYFTGQSEMQSGNPADVGIGISEDSVLQGKLDVLNVSTTDGENFSHTNLYAGRFVNTGIGTAPTSHWGHLYDIIGDQFAAVYGNSSVGVDEETKGFMNIGGDFTASNSTINVGTRCIVGKVKTQGANMNIGTLSITGGSDVAYGSYNMAVGASTGTIGVYGSGYNGANYNYGVWGQTAFEHDSTSGAGVANYAVYGELGDSGATTPDFAGYFNGDLGTTAGFYQVSDEKFKRDIKPVDGNTAMDLLNQLQPKTYQFNNSKFKSMALPFGEQYGLISQDVEKVLPGLIKNSVQAPKTDGMGKIIIPPVEYKALNYTGMIPLLIAGVKEVDSTNDAQQFQNDLLQNQVSTLQQQFDELKLQMQQLTDCCTHNTGTTNPTGMNTGGGNQTVVELNNYAIILDQNSPNPFAEQTTITFKIPVDIKEAKILFSDDRGSVLKTVMINTRGDGSLLIYASNLSSGIYSYSLLADGKLIDTKKMICQKR